KKAHTPAKPVQENWNDSTCANEGSYDEVVYCSACHVELSRETKVINKKAHTPGQPVQENRNDSTCANEGSYDEVVYCSKCGDEISRVTKVIDKKAHTPAKPVQENWNDSTCANEGSYDEVVYCSECDAEISRVTKVIGKKAHTPAKPVQENRNDSTCANEGSYDEVVYCSECGDEISRVTKSIDKKAHTPSQPVQENVTAPTCINEGSYDEVVYCSVCHVELSRVTREIERTSHTVGAPVRENVTDSTCIDEGSYDEVIYCSVCHVELSRVTKAIDKKAHTEVIDAAVPAACEDAGLTEGSHCSVCGEILVAQETVDALGHDYEAVVTDPTCTEEGCTTHICTRCGDSYVDDAVEALGHVWDDGVVTQRPTPTVDGIMTYTCERCGETRTEPIPSSSVYPGLPAPDPDEGGGPGTGNDTTIIDEEDTPLADLPFEDVLPSDWFYDAVMYVYNRGLMNGVSDTLFDPYGILNRAMVVTILYRVEGEPETEPSSFKDVEAGKWYTDAIGWGAANGIVKGYDEDRFGPLDPVTREQLAAILYRYAQYKGYDVTDATDLSIYTDAAEIHEYAVEAMQWAIAIGAPTALDGLVLSPRENATRAQVAEAFMNFCEKYMPLEAEGEAA
ncbi:MAG: hypothetical protein HDT18_01950, partial [Oscillibacter sp.]|nr:hypothetical protein [Oscillibacter sp.]